MRKYLLFLIISSSLLIQCSKSDVLNTSNLNSRSVGASANELLSANTYQSIHMQVQYMPGYSPDPTSLNNLVAFLNTLINKPGGITISQSQIAASGKPVLTLSEINEIEKSNRTIFTTGSTIGVYLLFTDGKYTDNNAVGLAYRNTSMAVFGQTVEENSGGINQVSRTKLETTIEEHEFGHILGLVDLGSPMQVNHKDPSSNHCNNASCLMYFATTVMGGIGISGPVLPLDANCRNDLRANGGK